MSKQSIPVGTRHRAPLSIPVGTRCRASLTLPRPPATRLSVCAKARAVRTETSVSLSSVRNGGEGRGEEALRNIRPLALVTHPSPRPSPRSCLTGRGRRTRSLSQRSRHELSQRFIAPPAWPFPPLTSNPPWQTNSGSRISLFYSSAPIRLPNPFPGSHPAPCRPGALTGRVSIPTLTFSPLAARLGQRRLASPNVVSYKIRPTPLPF